MATNAEPPRVNKIPRVPPEEEIVISGVAGRFPDSNNMKHFQENLMNKVDLVTDDDRRWKLGVTFCLLSIMQIYFFLFVCKLKHS